MGPRRLPRALPAAQTRAPRLLAVLALLAALVLTGCQPAATPSPSAVARDFTLPGAASGMIDELTAAAGSSNLVLVQVSRSSVLVSVLEGTTPVTWAYRDGKVAEVPSDLAYVDQASFSIDRFNISDVGGLFRAAAGVAGSEENQTLQIVDYSGGRVMMAVTTNPESRAVFFQPDGAIMPAVDFHAAGGIEQALTEVLAGVGPVYAIGVQSSLGAWVDHPGTEKGTTVRRQRTAKVPVTTTIRSERSELAPFRPSLLRPAVIWTVVQRISAEHDLTGQPDWTMTMDDRAETGVPRLYFTVGGVPEVTDLAGTPLAG
jgi:hypothetical protein